MTLRQIEKAFENRGIEYERHLSGISKSAYYTFNNTDGDPVRFRVSNHDLPASYSDRGHRVARDFRYTDKMGEISAFIESVSGKKIEKKAKKTLSDEYLTFLESEAKSANVSIETIKRIYGVK